VRSVLNSRTYQLSSQTTELNRDDTRFFSHARIRTLSAEQLLDAVCQVTDVKESYPNLPADTLATEIPSPDFNHDFLDTFGRPARTTACACERRTQSTLAQAIELINGSLIRKKVTDGQNRIHRLRNQERTSQEIVEELYRSAVCRSPNDAETKAALDYVAAKSNATEGWEDVCWALLNTDEFLTQH
jgi:hypothetical protein